MKGTPSDVSPLLAACVMCGAIHHLVMLCVLGAKAVYAPLGALIVAVGFSQMMPWHSSDTSCSRPQAGATEARVACAWS